MFTDAERDTTGAQILLALGYIIVSISIGFLCGTPYGWLTLGGLCIVTGVVEIMPYYI